MADPKDTTNLNFPTIPLPPKIPLTPRLPVVVAPWAVNPVLADRMAVDRMPEYRMLLDRTLADWMGADRTREHRMLLDRMLIDRMLADRMAVDRTPECWMLLDRTLADRMREHRMLIDRIADGMPVDWTPVNRIEKQLPRLCCRHEAIGGQGSRASGATVLGPISAKESKPKGKRGPHRKRSIKQIKEAIKLRAENLTWTQVARKIDPAKFKSNPKGASDSLRLDVGYYNKHPPTHVD
jgi:hypothetical protein